MPSNSQRSFPAKEALLRQQVLRPRQRFRQLLAQAVNQRFPRWAPPQLMASSFPTVGRTESENAVMHPTHDKHTLLLDSNVISLLALRKSTPVGQLRHCSYSRDPFGAPEVKAGGCKSVGHLRLRIFSLAWAFLKIRPWRFPWSLPSKQSKTGTQNKTTMLKFAG